MDLYNNHLSNLEWVTASENMSHAWKLAINKAPKRGVFIQHIRSGDVLEFESIIQCSSFLKEVGNKPHNRWCLGNHIKQQSIIGNYRVKYKEESSYDEVIDIQEKNGVCLSLQRNKCFLYQTWAK